MIGEMSGDAPQSMTFAVSTEPPAPTPIWPAVAMGVAVLLVAIALAWRRRRAPMSERPRRVTRMVVAAAIGGGGGALIRMTASGAIFTEGRGIGWDPFGPSPAILLPLHLLLYCLFAFALIGTTDLLFDALRPRPSLLWLIIGAPLFGAFIIAVLRVTGWVDPFVVPPTRDQAALAVAALAAGLSRWAWLPAAWRPIAHIFE
jgi:MYXO-CTERM domain-containing protein